MQLLLLYYKNTPMLLSTENGNLYHRLKIYYTIYHRTHQSNSLTVVNLNIYVKNAFGSVAFY
jgi:hypothetical protein